MTGSGTAKWYSRYCPISGPMFARICKDYWLVLTLGTALALSFHWLYVTFLPLYNLRYKLRYIKQLPGIVKAMIGGDLFDIISTTSLGAFAYVHPISLMLLIGFAMLLPTGLIVGQIDRGTIELVLSTPLSRKKFMLTNLFAGGLAGAILTGGMILGTWIGVQYTHEKLPEPYELRRIFLCVLNLYMLYLLAMSAASFLSAISSIRGWAVGWTFGICLVAYLMHFMSEWWKWVANIAFIGPMYYYHPIKIATGKYDPTGDMLAIGAATAVLMILSVICFCRRNIAVV